jgi:hypothetical protein
VSYRNRIHDRLKKSDSPEKIALGVYVVYQTAAMKGLDDMKFDILYAVSEKFQVNINNVLIAGSAQTGESFHKSTTFNSKTSDLDIAIVDSGLYEKYLQITHTTTRDYSDLSGFSRKEGVSVHKDFLENLGRGFFRPDLMPTCSQKNDWFHFFQELSKKYYNNFESINCGIYSSLHFFQMKQTNNIEIVKNQKGK